MKLTFIGTRAYIPHSSKEHQYDASCIISHRATHVLIDCGTKLLGQLKKIKPIPQAVVLTHAHLDHVEGLKKGCIWPVYGTKETLLFIKNYPLRQRHVIKSRHSFSIGDITFEAFRVEHSIDEPAVGYRITAGNKSIFYVPDLVFIRQRKAALKGVTAYIGDGARIMYPLIRKKGTRQMGHGAFAKQLAWCCKERVQWAIVTHCGSEIVTKPQQARQKFDALSKRYGVKVTIAHDGMVIEV